MKQQNKNNIKKCAKIIFNKYFILIYFFVIKYTINAVINVTADTNITCTLPNEKNLFNNEINESHKSPNIYG